MTEEELEKEKEDGVISWKYSNLEKYFEEPYKTICNNFDCIIHYNPKEGWLIVQKLRYGLQGDESSEIIKLEDTLFIKDISKLENYFYMGNSLDKAIYDSLKKDLSKRFGCHVDNAMNVNESSREMTKEKLEEEAEDCAHDMLWWLKMPINEKNVKDGGYHILKLLEPRENRIKELEDALEYTRKLYGDELEKAYKEINNTNGTLQVAKEMSNESLREKNQALRKQISEAKDIIFDLVVAYKDKSTKPLALFEEIERAKKFLEEEI